MQIKCHHLDKWLFTNLDLAEEVLEKKKRCAICIGGASSAGKSYCAKNLVPLLELNNHKAVVISTDNYNKGISGIIADKVDEKYFNNRLPHRDKVVAITKDVLNKTDFENKFDDECCAAIRAKLNKVLPPAVLDKYIESCQIEIKHLNFDEPTVYDLKAVANDLKALLAGKTIKQRQYSKVLSEQVPSDKTIDGRAYDIFLVEGIYVLSNYLLHNLDRNLLVTNFVESSPKSLFLRRVIRDAAATSAPSYYTIGMYFNNIVPSYNETIWPSLVNADVVFENNMSSGELREGTLYLTRDRFQVQNSAFAAELLKEAKVVDTIYQKDIYLIGKNEPSDFNNLLRLREISEDEGQSYDPSSLVHKGATKARKDGKSIRPINILLKEGTFTQAFTDESDFLTKMAEAGLAIDRTVYKIKRHLIYKGYKATLSDFKEEGFWLELTDPRLPAKLGESWRTRAQEQ